MRIDLNVLINQKLLHVSTNTSELKDLAFPMRNLKLLTNIYEVSMVNCRVFCTLAIPNEVLY
jgi:hypothetical protein